MKPKKLGRGLSSLLSGSSTKLTTGVTKRSAPKPPPSPPPIKQTPTNETIKVEPVATKDETKGLSFIPVKNITPNRFQPRKDFDQESLRELMDSIKTAGILQPVIVRKTTKGYELVTGERRWRASKELKIDKIPAIVKEVDDRMMLEWALIENIQRKDLNPIERAQAYKELGSHFQLTHDQIAQRVGLERATITNFIRLLELPDEVQKEVSRGTITMGHARCLLSVNNRDALFKLLRRIKNDGLSVRRLEHIIAKTKKPSAKTKTAASKDPYLKELEDRLRRKFGTKIDITSYRKRGCITIEFYSNDDFQRILELLGT